MTRQYVTVALNGDGGDEAFAGYDRYLASRLALRYARLPTWLREGLIAPVAYRLPESTRRKDPLHRLKRFVLAMNDTPERRYAHWMALFDNKSKNTLYSPDFRSRMDGVDSVTLLERAFAAADSSDLLDRTQFADVTTYLLDDLLVKVDIATMVHSLEGRSPFLDHHLAEFAAQLPSNYKLRGHTGKYILKQALFDHLPRSILQRDKQGFGLPIARWFRHELRHIAYDVLLDQRTLARDLMNGEAVRVMLDEHVHGRINHHHRIWGLLVLELWFRAYIDRPRSELTTLASELF